MYREMTERLEQAFEYSAIWYIEMIDDRVEELTEEDGRNIELFRALEKSVKEISPALMQDAADLAAKYPEVFEQSLTTLRKQRMRPISSSDRDRICGATKHLHPTRDRSTGARLDRRLHSAHVRACHLQADLGRNRRAVPADARPAGGEHARPLQRLPDHDD